MFVDIFFRECSFLEEFFNVDIQSRFLVLDYVVHSWLSEGRLVGFIVTLFTIADDVDDDIRLKLLAPVCGELMDECYCFDIVTVDVEDRTVICFTDVGSIRG